ncbi:MAG TPA: hypothetical protein VNA19_12030 [Pyrinomonadaceae bacterium]|nr:hypothetical protein [Pyrinomonadaceae bacterium]
MSETNGQKMALQEESPAEKLQDDKPTGSLIPGAENPESTEIKREINPNTE